MNAVHISRNIIEYKRAYECLGVQNPPPYRITCKEHKELISLCNTMIVKPTFSDEVGFTSEPFAATSMLAYYYGVQIEVVMIIEPYL